MLEMQASSKRMTVLVICNGKGWIVDAAPIVREFIGQPYHHLTKWMSKQGGFTDHVLGRPYFGIEDLYTRMDQIRR